MMQPMNVTTTMIIMAFLFLLAISSYPLRVDGVVCTSAADCEPGHYCNLVTPECVATSCEDSVISGAETDVDCGGMLYLFYSLRGFTITCTTELARW
jgi:hypothetical protein